MPEPTSAPRRAGTTLEEVENDRWGPAPADATFLVRRGHELRQVPLRDLDTEGLRLLLGQQIGVPVLVPLALALLSERPLAEGDFYPGDLLAAVLRIDDDYWLDHPDQAVALIGIVGLIDPASEALDVTDLRVLITRFREARARR